MEDIEQNSLEFVHEIEVNQAIRLNNSWNRKKRSFFSEQRTQQLILLNNDSHPHVAAATQQLIIKLEKGLPFSETHNIYASFYL